MSQHMESLKLGDSVRQLPSRDSGCGPIRVRALTARRTHAPQLAFEGPKGRFTYKGRGVFAVKQLPSQARGRWATFAGQLAMPPHALTSLAHSQGGGEKLRKCTHVGMIAGGTGITPMLQVCTCIFALQACSFAHNAAGHSRAHRWFPQRSSRPC